MSPLHHVNPSAPSSCEVIERLDREAPHQRAEHLLNEAEKCGDPELRESLLQQAVVLTLDLADATARRYYGRGMETEDLCQVGRLALVKAARGYQRGRGSGFAAYAVPTIAGEIKRHFRDCGWAVRPPRRLQELRADTIAAEDRLRQELGREATVEELARALRADVGQVLEARLCRSAYQAVSLDDSADSSGRSPAVPVAQESGDFDEVDRRDALHQAVAVLSAREQRIVWLRFGEERTQSEIGAVLGVSQMQVSRLLSGILTRLRKSLREGGAAA
jgi:RNA polymerase sigma-B factor